MSSRRTLVFALALGLLAACDRATPPPHEHGAAGETAHAPVYQCPMHPQIIRHEPGTCPICGMTLQRVDDAAGGSLTVPGHAGFVLTPERQQAIGVTRAPVERRTLTREIRAAARVANDPALYAALIEYREAARTRDAVRAAAVRDPAVGGDGLVRAAALKLRRMGIGERELAALANLDPTTLMLPGPRVWVYAEIFEEDAPLITPGMPLTIEVPAEPDHPYASTVFAIDPTVSPESRTVRVRALVPTPDASLRPDAYVTAVFHVSLGERLVIPRAAVLDSGAHRLVFVVADDGRFTPRDVRLGPVADRWVTVLDGVAEGEQVVTSANFLIDSESRLRAAVAAFGADAPHAHP